MQKWIIFIIIFLIVVLGVIIVLNVDIETEYVPETEIEETELRKTIVTLYFKDMNSGELSKETRMIDSKELLKNPYKSLLQMLFSGPENANYTNEIPTGTTIIETSFNNGCVIVNLSKEFTENVSQEQINNSKEAIYKTLIELTEVTSVKIIIEGNEVENVSDIISKETFLDSVKEITNTNQTNSDLNMNFVNTTNMVQANVTNNMVNTVQTNTENDEAIVDVE